MDSQHKTKAQLIKENEQLRAELKDVKQKHQQCQNNISEIKKTQKLLDDLIDKNPISIQIVDKYGFSIRTNQAHSKLFLAKPEKTFCLFSENQLLDLGFHKYLERLKNGKVVVFPDHPYNARLVNNEFPDNKVWLRVVAFPIFDHKKQPESYVLMHVDITKIRNLEIQLTHKNKRLRALYANFSREIENQLQTISRKLHDEIKQKLVYITMDSDKLIGELENPAHKKTAERIFKTSHEIIFASLNLLSDLRTTVLDRYGLKAGLQELISEFITRYGLHCQSEIHDIPELPPQMATEIYRIVQQALNNAGSHSDAGKVSVVLKSNAGNLHIAIADNGRGILQKEIISDHSFGIMGMKERTEILKGKYTISGKPGIGTTVEIEIPLPKAK